MLDLNWGDLSQILWLQIAGIAIYSTAACILTKNVNTILFIEVGDGVWLTSIKTKVAEIKK